MNKVLPLMDFAGGEESGVSVLVQRLCLSARLGGLSDWL